MVDNESGKNAREIPYLFYKSGTRKPAKYVIGGTPHTAKSPKNSRNSLDFFNRTAGSRGNPSRTSSADFSEKENSKGRISGSTHQRFWKANELSTVRSKNFPLSEITICLRSSISSRRTSRR